MINSSHQVSVLDWWRLMFYVFHNSVRERCKKRVMISKQTYTLIAWLLWHVWNWAGKKKGVEGDKLSPKSGTIYTKFPGQHGKSIRFSFCLCETILRGCFLFDNIKACIKGSQKISKLFGGYLKIHRRSLEDYKIFLKAPQSNSKSWTNSWDFLESLWSFRLVL